MNNREAITKLLRSILLKDLNFLEIKSLLTSEDDLSDLQIRKVIYLSEKTGAVEADYYGGGETKTNGYCTIKYSRNELNDANIETFIEKIYQLLDSFAPQQNKELAGYILKILEQEKKTFLEIKIELNNMATPQFDWQLIAENLLGMESLGVLKLEVEQKTDGVAEYYSLSTTAG